MKSLENRRLRRSLPMVDNGKLPHEPMNIANKNLFGLPSDTPYGNFQLKLFKISHRIDKINIDIMKINYESIGDGEPLVMLHPNGHCIKDWHILN